jgi:hypothetical protein
LKKIIVTPTISVKYELQTIEAVYLEEILGDFSKGK